MVLGLASPMKRRTELRTDSTERDWADAGLGIGSPNDPAIGEAYNQTTGPGGKGLMARPKNTEVSDAELARNHFYNG